MTDVEMERLSAICAVANVNDIEDLSDGFHTFNDLYEQRMYLFAALVDAYKDKAWKSLKYEDGEPCFGGDWFIVGIDTPEGSYTYHYSIKYWDVFDCEVLPKAKHWDGHTDKDVTRLMSLQTERMGRWIRDVTYYPRYHCNRCGEKTDNTIMGIPRYKYCPNCGAHMENESDG